MDRIGLSVKLPFLNKYPGTIDDKGRLSIPADFRHALSPDCDNFIVFTLGSSKYINAFPLDFFNKFWDQADSFSGDFESDSVRRRNDILIAGSCYKQLDGQGRITLPQNMVKDAKIGREIVYVGQRTHFVIWDAKAYDEYMSNNLMTAGEAWKQFIDQNHRK